MKQSKEESNYRRTGDNLDGVWTEFYNLLEQRNFNKLETNTLLIGTPAAHRKMVKLLKENPSMSEEEFLREAEKIEEEVE